jgi:aryl-alcohol dehydrogenase-like predicted oxidoreductase
MRYKLLGNSGLRVSELCVGTMTFGDEWGWGSSEQESEIIYNIFREAGGNFLDTANRYTEGTSEKILGKLIQNERDRVVLATKYSLFTKPGDLNDGGNHRKNLVQSLEGSLKRLQTDYVDVLYLHAWDGVTPTQEVMRALDDLVRAGKVLYIGISDVPAWTVARANTLAELRGWTSFIGLQIEYSLLQRTPERELLPMADAFGMSVVAWSPLAGGALTGRYLTATEGGRLKPESRHRLPKFQPIVEEVVAVAQEIRATPSQVALAWIRSKHQSYIPIVGARKAEHLHDNLGCIEVVLGQEQLERLNNISAIELGFPHDFLKLDSVQNVIFGGQSSKLDKPKKTSL